MSGRFRRRHCWANILKKWKRFLFYLKFSLIFFFEKKTTTSSWDWRKFLTRAKTQIIIISSINSGRYCEKENGRGVVNGIWTFFLGFSSRLACNESKGIQLCSAKLKSWVSLFGSSFPPVASSSGYFDLVLESRRCLTTFWLRQYSLLLLLLT